MTSPVSDQPLVNQLLLAACLVESSALRFTPSGLPALSSVLEHASETREFGQVRQVKATLQSVSFGAVAERLANQAIGSCWTFKGYLASPRGGKRVVFHIQEFSEI